MPQVRKTRSFHPSSRKKMLVLLLIVLVAGGIGYAAVRNKGPNSTTPAPYSHTQNSSKKPTVNLNPPTQAEKNATRDSAPTKPSQASSEAGKKLVSPVITSADKSETRAFISTIIEDGGTCTATYTHGADSITASSKGFSDVSHTTCAPMVLNGPVNISGDWSVTVTYSSSNYFGTSTPSKFKVN